MRTPTLVGVGLVLMVSGSSAIHLASKDSYLDGEAESSNLRSELQAPTIIDDGMRMAESSQLTSLPAGWPMETPKVDDSQNLLQVQSQFEPPGAGMAHQGGDPVSLIRMPPKLVNADAIKPMALAEAGASAGEEQGADLESALNELKDDIVARSHQVMEEKKWVDQVKTITSEYELKMRRVEVNIANIRGQVKDMFKKKKQIENLMLQEKLQGKLKDATADLTVLQTALSHTKAKANSFARNKQGVVQTIDAIKQQLSKLQGNSDADGNGNGNGNVNGNGNANAEDDGLGEEGADMGEGAAAEDVPL